MLLILRLIFLRLFLVFIQIVIFSARTVSDILRTGGISECRDLDKMMMNRQCYRDYWHLK